MHESLPLRKAIILLVSFVYSAGVYLFLSTSLSSGYSYYTQIEEWYGFASVILLFFALLAGPLYRVFPTLPFKIGYYGSLGGLGISAFYFALLHSLVSLVFLLHGFAGLSFLQTIDFVSIMLGFGALLILAALAGTSFTFAMNVLGKKWKALHRLVYVAAFSVLAHISLTGNHYENTASVLYVVTLAGVMTLLVLHAIIFQRYISSQFPRISSYWWTVGMIVIGLLLGYGLELFHMIGHHHQ